jgi:hypothetical protein
MMRDINIMKALAFLIIASSLIFGGLGCDKEKEKRKSDKINPLSEFRAEIVIENPPTVLNMNSSSTFKVKVKNVSNSIWPALSLPDGKLGVHLCYHWLNKDGKVEVLDGLRTILPHDVKPNEELVLDAKVSAPDKKGDYIIEFDMVQEAVAWFKDKGSKTTQENIKVK